MSIEGVRRDGVQQAYVSRFQHSVARTTPCDNILNIFAKIGALFSRSADVRPPSLLDINTSSPTTRIYKTSSSSKTTGRLPRGNQGTRDQSMFSLGMFSPQLFGNSACSGIGDGSDICSTVKTEEGEYVYIHDGVRVEDDEGICELLLKAELDATRNEE